MQRIKTFIHDHPHIWWGLFLPVYLGIFFTIEHFITDNYWATQLPIDYKIPFLEGFAPIYASWSVLLFILGIYLILKDGEGFRRYMWSIMITFLFSTLICALIPNGQDLRPDLETLGRENLFTRLIGVLYASDTNTNVCPSLHVVGSLAAWFAVLHNNRLRRTRWVPVAVGVLACLISVSTVMIKQHSLLDVIVGVPYALILYRLLYWSCGRIITPKNTP